MKKLIWTMGIAMAPLALLAHPGHGESEGFSITHYFTEPVHAGIAILSVAAVSTVVMIFRRRASRQQKS